MPAQTSASARRFAEAVFELAQEEHRLDAWEQDLALLAQVFSGEHVVDWLSNPGVPLGDKEALIDSGLASTGQEVRNLARLLISRGRVALTEQILALYRERLDQVRGILHARVTTAVALRPEERDAILARLVQMTRQQVTIETVVDPAIIGGVVVRIGDRLLDGSARARLMELKRRLAGAGR